MELAPHCRVLAFISCACGETGLSSNCVNAIVPKGQMLVGWGFFVYLCLYVTKLAQRIADDLKEEKGGKCINANSSRNAWRSFRVEVNCGRISMLSRAAVGSGRATSWQEHIK
jgi:hypothetical protein